MSARADSLIEYPCDFPIKVMGKRVDSLAQTVVSIVQKHAPDFEAGSLEMRSSSQGNYLSLTVTIRATSRAQQGGYSQRPGKNLAAFHHDFMLPCGARSPGWCNRTNDKISLFR